MSRFTVLFVVGLTLVLRAPFFGVDVIDWDESTFILMGDAWARGSLPYTSLWDNKPPLCFAPFALLQLLVGKSIVAVRILGALTTVGAGLAIAVAGTRLRSERLGVFAGAATVVLVTFASRGQATMSETLAVAPLAWAALPHLTDRVNARSALGSGVLLSVATLIRFNLALVAMALLLWLLFERRPWRVVGAYALGGAIPLALLVGVYGAAGEADTFWTSVFVAPFAYALGGLALASLQTTPWTGLAATPLLRTAGPPPVFWVFVLSVAASIGLSGGGAAHYWIQIHPFTGLLLGFLLAPVVGALPKPWVAAFMLLIPVAAGLSDTPWKRIGERSRTRDVVTYLDSKGARGQPVLLLTEHLAHWWLDSQPIHPMATHPSNLFRPELVAAVTGSTPKAVLEEILGKEPLYVLRERNVRRLDDVPEAKSFLEATLRERYTLEETRRGVMFFRRADAGRDQ